MQSHARSRTTTLMSSSATFAVVNGCGHARIACATLNAAAANAAQIARSRSQRLVLPQRTIAPVATSKVARGFSTGAK